MMDTNVKALLVRHESRRSFVYDDKTGLPIKPGTLVQGNPSIGIGRNLSGKGISQAEEDYLLENDYDEVLGDLQRNLTWFDGLDAVRAAVMIDMCFNMGWTLLSEFDDFLALMSRGSYHAAAEDLARTKWYTENHGGKPDSRAADAYAMLVSGEWPDDIKGVSV